jgi:nucleolar protein 58
MDKLQNEYEALQQKLALLKRDSIRDGKPQCTPMASIPGPRLAAAAAAVDAPPSRAQLPEAPASVAPDSVLPSAAALRAGSSSDTGPLSFSGMSVLQSCENLQLTCSIPDAGGVLQSLKFQAKYPGSRMAQLAEGSFSDAEFVQLCEQGLTAQLQRTRDGATAQSRITELAGVCYCKSM